MTPDCGPCSKEIDEAFIALDWEYRCVHANEAALRMTGKALSDLLGRRPWDLRPAFVDAPATSAMREAMELGRPSVYEFRSPADGSWYEVRVYPTPAGMAAYFREISARKNIEAEREQLIAAKQESARLAAALNEINDQIHSSLAVEEIMRRALEGAARALSADAGTIELREADRWVVRLQHRLRKQDVGTSLAGADSPVASAATARGAPVAVADLAASEEMNGRFVRSHGLKSVLAVPFTVTGAGVGVLLLYHKKRTHAFDGAEVDFAGLLGSSLSLALKNSHLYQAEQEAQRQARHELKITEVLLDASAVVAEWTELHPMLDRLGDVLLRSAAHSRVTIGLWDEACKQMTTVVSKGRHPIPLSTMRLDEMSPPARKMIKTRKSILIDYARAMDDRLRELAAQRLLRYALAVPVLARGRLVATITVDAPGENQAFSEREVALVQSVADQAAVAIDNARLVATGQAELARTTLLKEIAAIGASTLDLEDLAQSALMTAQRLLGATTGTLFVVDDAAGVLRSLANFGIAKEVLDEVRELPLGSETTGTRAALSGDLVTHYSDGVPDTAARLRRVTGTAGSGWVIVPVKVRRKTLGILGLSFATARPFLDDELALFQSLADQLGVAMDKARLFAAEHEARQAAAERAAQLEFMHEITEVATSSLSVSEIAEGVLESLAAKFGFSQATVLLADRERGELVPVATFGFPPGFHEAMPRLTLNSGHQPALAFRTGEPVLVEDLDRASVGDEARTAVGTAEALTGRPIKAWLFLPLRGYRDVLGALGFNWSIARVFTKGDITFFGAIAHEIAIGLENARLFEAAGKELDRTALLKEVASLAAGSLDEAELAQRTLDAVARFTNAFGGLIYKVDRETSTVRAIATFGPEEFVAPFRETPLDEAYAIAKAVLGGETLTHETHETSAAAYRRAAGTELTEMGRVFVPIKTGREAAAGLALIFPQKVHFSEQELGLYGSVADQLGVAMDKARLFAAERELRERAERHEAALLCSEETARKAEERYRTLFEELAGRAGLAEALNAIDNLVHSTLDFDEIMQRALDEGAQALGADAGTIEIREGSFWVVRYQHGLAGADAELRRPDMESPIARRTALRREPFTIADVKATAEVDAGFMRKHALRSVLAVPLLAHDTVGGCLLFYGKSPRVFGDSEIDFGRKLGATVSLAAESARLLRAQVEAQRRAEQELETTRLLLEAADSLAESLALSDILATLARIVLDVGGHTRVTVSLWQEESGWLEVALSGTAVAAVWRAHRLGRSLRAGQARDR